MENGWAEWLELMVNVKDKKKLEGLFTVLLTSEERAAIGKRCLIIKALLEGELTQRDMAKRFNLSIAKITRGSNELKRTPSDIIAILEKHLC